LKAFSEWKTRSCCLFAKSRLADCTFKRWDCKERKKERIHSWWF